MWVCVWSNTTFILRRDIERMHTLPDSQIPNMLARVGKLEKVCLEYILGANTAPSPDLKTDAKL